MGNDATLAELSGHINVVLRLAAAAYDQTTLLKQALLVLAADREGIDARTRARLLEVIAEVNGAEQEAQHAIRLMLRKRR